MVTAPGARGGAGVTALRGLLVLGCGVGFLLYVTAIERLAEHGKVSRDQLVLAVGLLAGCGLGILLLESSVQRDHPRHRLEVQRGFGCFAFALGGALFLLGSAWAFVTLQKETGAWAVDLGGFRAPVLAAIVGTVVTLVGALSVGSAIERRIRDPEKIPQVTRAKILALRGEGKTLAEIGEALDGAGLRAPGGVWTGRLLRGVIRSAPQKPPPG
jgi:hypothetical protein